MVDNSEQTAEIVPLKNGKCPACGKIRQPDYRPFCSKRCADLDLGRWLNEAYRIPVEEGDKDGDGSFLEE